MTLFSSSLTFHVYQPSAAAYQTFGVERLMAIPPDQGFGGQDVEPLEGRAIAKPWSVDLVDYSTAVTSILADSSGRSELIGQRAGIMDSTDYPVTPVGSVWQAVGRISDITLQPDQSWRFVMEDDLQRIRHAPIFVKQTTSNGTQLYPPGVMANWSAFTARGAAPGQCVSTFNNLSQVTVAVTSPISQEIIQEISKDFEGVYDAGNATSSDGNFRHLRLNIAGTDYPIFGFGHRAPYGMASHLDLFMKDPVDITQLQIWITGLSSAFSPAGTDDGTPVGDCVLYLSSAPPSEVCPIHIGTSAGIHPFQLLKDVLDGNYGSSDVLPNYASAPMTALINDKSIPRTWFRITESQPMLEWLEENILKPYGAVLLTDPHDNGQAWPATIFLPDPDNHPSTALFAFTSTNLREAPTWIQSKRSICTVTRMTVDTPSLISDDRARQTYSFPADMIQLTPFTTEFTHDRVGTVGRHVRDIYLGVNGAYTLQNIWQEKLAREIFERYGDGAIWGELQGVFSTASGSVGDVNPGDFVKVTLSLYPNIGIQGRGGTRVVQIMSRSETPEGPVFEYLDAAEDPPAIAAPTLSVANSTRNPKHALTVTLSGNSTATSSGPAAGHEIEVANSASTLAANSTLWTVNSRSIYRQPRSTDPWYISSGVFDITGLKSGSTWFVRARFGLYQGYHSAWTYTTAGVATSELTGPSGLTASNHAISSIDYAWTNSTASTGYPIEFRYSTDGGTLTRKDVLSPGTQNYRLTGLTSGTTYTADIRHIDIYGGVSASTSLSTATTGTSTSCPALQSFFRIYGSNTSEPWILYY